MAGLGWSELVDQREDVAVVLAKELAEMLGRLSVDVLARGEDARVGEVLVELVVELLPVGDLDEGPVAGQLAQDLLREPQVGEGLAAALRVPKHPELRASLGPRRMQRLDGVVDTQVLVVLRHRLDEPTRPLGEGDEVLRDVKQPITVARATQRRLEANDPHLALGVDLLPLREVIPGRVRRADLGVGTVREDDEGVEPEDLADGVPVVTQVVVVGVPHVLVRHLQLDENERNAVDEQHDVGSPPIHLAGHPELRHGEPIVRLDVVPVNEANGDGRPSAIDLGLDLRPVAQ